MDKHLYKNLDKKELEKLSKDELIKMLENMNNVSLNKQLKERDIQLLERERKIKKLETKLDKTYAKLKENNIFINELLKIVEKKEFQRVSQILRTYNIKSEKVDVIANEAEVIKSEAKIDETNKAKAIEEKVKSKPGRKEGTKNYQNFDLSKFPTKDIYVKDPTNLNCDECGAPLIKSGENIVTKLNYIPGSFEIIKYHYNEFKCPYCDERNDKEYVDIFNDSLLTPNLAANIINNKYNYAIPLYRQEDIFKKIGIPLSRVSLSNYVIDAANLLKPLYELMIKDLIATPINVLQADETTFKCILDCKKDNRNTNYVFVYSTTFYDKSIRIYSYSNNRSTNNPKEILKGFKGYLECDGYDGYNNIKDVTPARCWAHVRRKFADIVKALPEKQKNNSVALKIVKKINELFKIEDTCKKDKLIPSKILEVRNKKSKPIVEDYFKYIEELKDKAGDPLLGAINYSLKLKNELMSFLNNGFIPLENNLSERTVKPFVIMRKNALFAYSKEGAISSCILMSLVMTAKENCLDVEKYLSYVLTQLNTSTTAKLKELLPYSDQLPKFLLIKKPN